MFTDRFIKIPVEMYNRKEAEITGNDDASVFSAYMKINPMEIISYRPKYDTDQNEENLTIIDLKTGDDFIVLMPIDEFEKLLNSYNK